MPESIPTYIVSTGIGGDAAPTYATYVRRPSGSLRRVVSIDLPLCDSRLEALEHLAWWLHGKACCGSVADRAEYRRQLARVKAEIVAEGGTPDPSDTGWAYGIEGYGLERERRAKEAG